MARSTNAFLTLVPEENRDAINALAAPVRLAILKLLRQTGPMNVNMISAALRLPQSTIATNIKVLEAARLIHTEAAKAKKGQQKICSVPFDGLLIRLDGEGSKQRDDLVEVAMPIGLYTSCEVSAPCGLCSTEGIIGLLDVPDFFLDPSRMRASLAWFGRGYVEYKFPNNARLLQRRVQELEFSMELSSEVPGTNVNWPSDISIWVNAVKVGTWTSPGDFGDKRGAYTPRWWKLAGSQYGRLVTWRISERGSFVDRTQVSKVGIDKVDLAKHHSIRLRIGIDEGARHPGGVNIFGKGFGNHDQDIVMRMHLAKSMPPKNAARPSEKGTL
jgi:predicted transcriptional regulator